MVDLSFNGNYTFSNKSLLKEALAEVKSFFVNEDKSLWAIWKESVMVEELQVTIKLKTGCSQDDFWVYEGAVEILADYAETGLVQGWRDDYPEGEVEEYPALNGEVD